MSLADAVERMRAIYVRLDEIDRHEREVKENIAALEPIQRAIGSDVMRQAMTKRSERAIKSWETRRANAAGKIKQAA